MKAYLLLFAVAFVLTSCSNTVKEEKSQEEIATVAAESPQAISLFGDSLYAAKPSQKLLEKCEYHQNNYEADTNNIDNLIWYGRFTAYKGDYQEAINIYSQGIAQYPDESRLYRHRGHRYISIRRFDKAIEDFERATTLIQGAENEMEPDGMPNAQNIPVSSKHGNIWYHLGLAYYLKHDFEKALSAYQECLNSTQNADNLVSSTHWLYMILRRLDRPEDAQTYLKDIDSDLNVIENTSYLNACLFYKGEMTLEEFEKNVETGPGGDAMKYALGNWYFYNGEEQKAEATFKSIMEGTGWSSFGFIAAESDLAQSFSEHL